MFCGNGGLGDGNRDMPDLGSEDEDATGQVARKEDWRAAGTKVQERAGLHNADFPARRNPWVIPRTRRELSGCDGEHVAVGFV